MAPSEDLIGFDSTRRFVALVGGSVHQRASICHVASRELLHIEPFGAACALSPRDLATAEVLLAWDEGETIEELKGHLSIIGCWSPIIAINERPPGAQVVRAVLAGAIDYIDWNGDVGSLKRAVAAAADAKAGMLPRKQRQAEARRLLLTLSRRERQLLMAMAEGMSNKVIARVLKISPPTIEIHRANIMNKLHANSLADAIRTALEAPTVSVWAYADNWTAPWSLGDLLQPHQEGPSRESVRVNKRQQKSRPSSSVEANIDVGRFAGDEQARLGRG